MMYICILLPAVLAAHYDQKKSDDWYSVLTLYVKYCISINFFFLLFLLLLGRGEANFDSSGSVFFYFIYLLVGTCFAFLFPRVAKYVRKNFSFKVKRESYEKK